MQHLNAFKKNIYSQNGEDGVVNEILNRLEIKDEEGTFCEFGAADGKWFSNTYQLVERGWKGVMIEGSESFEKLKETAKQHHPNIVAINKFVDAVGENSLDNILKDTFLPLDFDLLSIDVDSIDYHIWDNFKNYKPKIVIIEVNTEPGPDARLIHPDSPYGGTTYLPTLELGESKKYSLVCHTGNMIFVRNDLAAGKFLKGKWWGL